MAIANKILRVQLRNGALINFDPGKIRHAMLSAAGSIGGFGSHWQEGVNDLFLDRQNEDQIATILSDMVVVTLNSDPRYHIPNFPLHIEDIQNTIIHVLRSYGFVDVADVYEVFRWGKHWMRQGAITPEQFVGNGQPEAKASEILRRNAKWGCDTVAGLNEIVSNGRMSRIVQDSLALYEGELDAALGAFDRRIARGDRIRIVTVAGPSSSGKTTTTVKVHQRLVTRGINVVMMNLDDYFWPAHQHPVDWMADRDYETPHALDYNLINQHLRDLLAGRKIEMPSYDFKIGDRVPGRNLELPPDSVLLLDCLHGLYPPLTHGIPEEAKFRIYIENMNMLREGLGTTMGAVRFTDIRMLRRMVRDHRHRNHSPLLTLIHWDKVRRSELANIIPLWGRADALVNGGLPFDLPVLKPFVDPLFPSPKDLARFPGHLDAHLRLERVRRLLDSIASLPQHEIDAIPGDATIREFIGGSTLKIPHND